MERDVLNSKLTLKRRPRAAAILLTSSNNVSHDIQLSKTEERYRMLRPERPDRPRPGAGDHQQCTGSVSPDKWKMVVVAKVSSVDSPVTRRDAETHVRGGKRRRDRGPVR